MATRFAADLSEQESAEATSTESHSAKQGRVEATCLAVFSEEQEFAKRACSESGSDESSCVCTNSFTKACRLVALARQLWFEHDHGERV